MELYFIVMLFLGTMAVFALFNSSHSAGGWATMMGLWTILYFMGSVVFSSNGTPIRMPPEYLEWVSEGKVGVLEASTEDKDEYVLYRKEADSRIPETFTSFQVSPTSLVPYRIKLDYDDEPKWYRWNFSFSDTWMYFIPKDASFEFLISLEGQAESPVK
jgi:hypothetical protein